MSTRTPVVGLAYTHLTICFLASFGVFAYRDLIPLGTFTMIPKDGPDGWITWVRLGLLGLGAVLIPIFTPRTYKPVDPEVSLAFEITLTEWHSV